MAVQLLDSQAELVRQLMTAGGYADEAAVVSAALKMLQRRQELHAMIQEGIDAVERGEVIPADEVFRDLRAHLASLPEKPE